MDSNEVDSLEIVIEAEASKAGKEIDKLVSKLTAVSSSLGKINTSTIKDIGTTSTKTGKELKNLSNSMGILSSNSNKTKKSFGSFAEAAGKFYANCFLIIRGIKKIGSAIEKSMDYVETFNYWNVSMDKIGSEFGSQFEQYGYDSAESYANSFSTRMKELTTKMTGYSIGSSGELTSTGNMGLALDPEQMMNYQSNILAVTNSLGLAGETSVNTAKALSMLSADMSSFKNVDLSTVMTNFQSGLIGQSRALYKYGIDITNATLQNYAYKNGITEAVSEMTQADKMQLRMLAILDQSKVAWGDQANTISSVANQYRILKQQISNLARVIGDLFLPIVQKVLPVVNGLIVALQRLFTTLGFKLFGNNWLTGIMDGISSGYSGDDTLGELEEDANNVSDSLGNAANEAKKLKGQLQGFDELNNLTSTQTTDSGSTGDSNADSGIDLSGAISDSLAEYESVWDKALADSQNKAQGYADTISSMFTNMWSAIEPFRNSISNLWDNGLSKLANFTWTSLGDFYDNFLVPIGTWAFGTEDSGLSRLVDIVNNSLMAINWNALSSSLSNFWTAIEPYTEQFGEGLIDFFEGCSGIAVDVINGIPEFLDGVTSALNNGDPATAREWGEILPKIVIGIMLFKGVASIVKGVADFGIALKSVQEGFSIIGSSISTVFSGIATFVSNIVRLFELVSGGFMSLHEAFVTIFGTVGTVFAGVTSIIGGLVIAVANFFSMWENGFSWLKEALMVIGIALAAVGAVILGVAAFPAVVVAAIVAAAATIAVVVHDNWDAICNWFSKAADWFDSKVITPICDFFKGLWESVSGFFVNLWNDIVGVWENVSGWFNDNVISPIVTVFEGFKLRISQVFEGLWIIVQAVWIVASTWFNENIVTPIVTAFNFLKDKVSEAFNYLWSGIKGVWSVVSGWFNTNIIAPVSNAFNVLRVAVSGAFNYLWSGIKGVWSGVANWFSNTVINPVRNAWQSATSAIGGFFNSLWSGIKWGVGSAMNSVIYGIESAINWIVSGINGIIGGFNKIVSVAAKIVGANWSGVSRLSRVYLGRVSMYADGGLPNTGEMFVARENGPELVGNIGNHSAVANNDQIVEGIRSGVSDANQETNTLLREQNNLLMRLLEKDTGISTRDIFNAVRSEDKAYRNINGHSALEY